MRPAHVPIDLLLIHDMSGPPPAQTPRLLPADALRPLVDAYPFPDPMQADARGLIGFGADLRPERLISAYAQGIFPWYDEDPILWFSPDPRMLLGLDELHVSRSLRRTLASGRYEVRFDTAFEAVMTGCRDAERPGQAGTWITDDMLEGYCRLHELGFAHSAESWREGELMGGVYGVSLGAAFFGESMFARATDASKVAFVHLVERLRAWDFAFLDCQVHTDHLARFGARERPRAEFLDALADALTHPTRCGSWGLG
jgi:leucyl/phenylalanyl-tRNA--protein transferase